MPAPSASSPAVVFATHHLVEAVHASDEGAVIRWLAEGGDPNRRVQVEELPGEFTEHSLLYVAWERLHEDRGSDRIMARLLDAGADPDGCPIDVWDRVVIDRCETVFEAFVRNGAAGRLTSSSSRHPLVQLYEEIPAPIPDDWITLLLDHGMDPSHWVHGMSLLGFAARAGDANTVRRLMAQGANPEYVDARHRTLLEVVRETASLLDDAGQRAGRRSIEALWVKHQTRTLRQTLDGTGDTPRDRPRL